MPKAPPPDPWSSLTLDGFVLLVGFLLGLFAALTARFWQSRIDEHDQRYEELRNAILRAAEISTDYWLKVGTLDDRQAEARLVGLFRLLNGLSVELARATRDSPPIHARRLVRFNDLLTGGPNYEIDQRPIDASRAMAVQQEAADLILYFQKYRRRRLTLWRSLEIAFRGPPSGG
ncbi:MAG: hypothetical protein OXK81_08835 [Chloroflexota bacterium]|nr:hypothetical protein [Chloroflexota bacterium]